VMKKKINSSTLNYAGVWINKEQQRMN